MRTCDTRTCDPARASNVRKYATNILRLNVVFYLDGKCKMKL